MLKNLVDMQIYTAGANFFPHEFKVLAIKDLLKTFIDRISTCSRIQENFQMYSILNAIEISTKERRS